MSTGTPQQPEPNAAPQQPAPDFPPQPAAEPQSEFDWQQSFSQGEYSEPEPPAEPPVDEGQQPPANPYLDQVRELGLDVPDDAAIEDILPTLIEQYRDMTPYANYGRGLMPHAQQISEALVRASQQAQQQQQPKDDDPPEWSPSDYFKEKWGAPEWNNQYTTAIQNGMVERNPQTGLFEAAKGYEQMVTGILPGLNEAHQFQAQQWQNLMRGNPYENFYEALQEPMKRQWTEDIRREIDRQFGRQQNMSQVQQFEAENASWMYQQDAGGQLVPSEKGRAFLGNVQMLRDSGMKNPQQIIAVAQQMMGAGEQQAAPQPPQVDEQPNTIPMRQQQQQHPQQPQKQSPQNTFLQNALDRAGHIPQSGAATVDSPDAPVNMSQGDLENAFIHAHRAKQGRAS